MFSKDYDVNQDNIVLFWNLGIAISGILCWIFQPTAGIVGLITIKTLIKTSGQEPPLNQLIIFFAVFSVAVSSIFSESSVQIFISLILAVCILLMFDSKRSRGKVALLAMFIGAGVVPSIIGNVLMFENSGLKDIAYFFCAIAIVSEIQDSDNAQIIGPFLFGVTCGILALFMGLESVIDAQYRTVYINWLNIFSGISIGFLVADILKSREQYKSLPSEVAGYLKDFGGKIT